MDVVLEILKGILMLVGGMVVFVVGMIVMFFVLGFIFEHILLFLVALVVFGLVAG